MIEPTANKIIIPTLSDTNTFRRILMRAVIYPVVLLIILIAIFLWQLNNMLVTNQQVQRTNTVISQATVVLKLLVDMESGVRGFLLTSDSTFLDPYTKAQAIFMTNYQHLQDMVTDDPTQANKLKVLQSNIQTWMKFAQDQLAITGGSGTAAQLTGKQEMDAIRDQLATFVDVQDQARADAIQAARTTTLIVILVVILGGIIVGVIVGLLTIRQLFGLSRTYERALAFSQQQAGEVQAQQEWLSGILSSIGDAVIATDTRGNITFINPITAQITGWSAAEVSGKPLDAVYKLTYEDDADASILASESKQLVTRDGKTIAIEDNNASIQDVNGKDLGRVIVFRDISRRKLIETERIGLIETQAHYANQLRQSNEQLQQFAYIASHDLQEPLRMVISYLQLLEQRYRDSLSEDAQEFIKYAVDGATRMRELISGLLQYARLDTAEQDIRQRISLQSALDKALTNLSVPIEENKATITHDPLPKLQADPMQMMQLLQNLIGNAIKFHGQEPLQIHVGAEKKTTEWQFSVSDNGIGIAPEYQKRIFGLFQRLHVSSAYSGTGIGLTICKKVVERHNGRIWVESTPGKGSTFYFTLPLEPAGASDKTNPV